MGRGRVRTRTSPGSTIYLSKFALLYRISRSTEPLQETKLLHEAPLPRFDTASIKPGNRLPFRDVGIPYLSRHSIYCRWVDLDVPQQGRSPQRFTLMLFPARPVLP